MILFGSMNKTFSLKSNTTTVLLNIPSFFWRIYFTILTKFVKIIDRKLGGEILQKKFSKFVVKTKTVPKIDFNNSH